MPLARSRNVVPDCVPSGTLNDSLPSSVGTSIAPPSARVVKFRGISHSQIVASRRKNACSAHFDEDVEIARRSARSAAFTFAVKRSRWP